MDEAEVDAVARAMAYKRLELIARPLASIWPDLARAALAASEAYRARDPLDAEDPSVAHMIREYRDEPDS
jgi:hypothetical protein